MFNFSINRRSIQHRTKPSAAAGYPATVCACYGSKQARRVGRLNRLFYSIKMQRFACARCLIMKKAGLWHTQIRQKPACPPSAVHPRGRSQEDSRYGGRVLFRKDRKRWGEPVSGSPRCERLLSYDAVEPDSRRKERAALGPHRSITTEGNAVIRPTAWGC
jgi:hypothetical protein